MGRLLSHLRSNAVAYLALFVALGGTAYAASLPANSVGTRQLKAGAVTNAKIKPDAVDSSKVEDASLQAQDFAAGVLLRGETGPAGTPGPPGRRGETGLTGGVDTTILWAVVQGGSALEPAVLERGRHAVSATRFAPGVYEVEFDRDVSSCAYVATLGSSSSAAIPGFSIPTTTSVTSKTGAADTVFVATAYLSGGFPTGWDGSFHLIVAC